MMVLLPVSGAGADEGFTGVWIVESVQVFPAPNVMLCEATFTESASELEGSVQCERGFRGSLGGEVRGDRMTGVIAGLVSELLYWEGTRRGDSIEGAWSSDAAEFGSGAKGSWTAERLPPIAISMSALGDVEAKPVAPGVSEPAPGAPCSFDVEVAVRV